MPASASLYRGAMDSTLFTRSADRAAHDDVNFRTRKWVKPEDLNANDLDQASKIIAGTARSMGITVEG